jgi:hypothetical protein
MAKTLVLELLSTKRRRSTKTILKKIREIDVNEIPTVFDDVSVGFHVVMMVHIAGLLVVACLVDELTYYLHFLGRSVTHFFLSAVVYALSKHSLT